jgi:adenylosuccinate synthase
VEVEYVTLPGWQVSIERTHQYEELPERCKDYVNFIESFLGVKIEWIGTGPGRYNMIRKELI